MSRVSTADISVLDFLRCSYPAVAVETHEETRLVSYLQSLPKQFKSMSKLKVCTISATQRLLELQDGKPPHILQESASYQMAFKYASERQDVLLLVFDLQHNLKNAPFYRNLKDHFPMLRANGSTVILVAPMWQLPQELEHDLPVIDFALPTREQLADALDRVSKDAGQAVLKGDDRRDCLDAMAGLTLQEAENACAFSMIKTDGSLSPELIANEKMRLIRSSGLVELAAPPAVEPGGLGELYSYINDEVIPVKDDSLLQCRGIILVGVQGCGKSLSAKAIGSRLRRPVLKANFGSLKGGIVGMSEANVKRVLRLADAVAPCVLWFDEIEKGVGGYASSDRSDGGVTSNMIAIWLEWLQEHTSQVFTVCTCNDFSKLPTELSRPGRFDERFFVDIPNVLERPEIALGHLKRYGKTDDAGLIQTIVDLSDQWTGAEIEQLCKSAARRTKGAITVDALKLAAESIRPISKVKEVEIRELRQWAEGALRPANTKLAGPTSGRKFRHDRTVN